MIVQITTAHNDVPKGVGIEVLAERNKYYAGILVGVTPPFPVNGEEETLCDN